MYLNLFEDIFQLEKEEKLNLKLGSINCKLKSK